MPAYTYECPICKARVVQTQVPIALRDQVVLGCPKGDGGAMKRVPDAPEVGALTKHWNAR
jgi:predicted nucleic acid-binding Zn ribbon protein